MLTDTRFWIGVGVGAAIIYFALPFVRGTIAAQQAGRAGR